MIKYRSLLEDGGVKILAPPSPEILARIQKKAPAAPKGDMDFSSEYLFKHKGRWVIDTDHAAERMVQRKQLTSKQMKFFFRKMIEKYLSMGSKYTNLNNPEFLFFSKSLNQGMIIAFRRDYKNIDSKKHFIIITFFPRGNKRARKGTETIMLEYLSKYQVIEID
jgi:hypothetical protein